MRAALTCSFCPRLVGHPVNPINRGGRLRPPLPATWQACFGSPSPCRVLFPAITAADKDGYHQQEEPNQGDDAPAKSRSGHLAEKRCYRQCYDEQDNEHHAQNNDRHFFFLPLFFLCCCVCRAFVRSLHGRQYSSTAKPTYRTDDMPRRRACVLSSSFVSSFPPRYRSAHSLPANSFQRFLK